LQFPVPDDKIFAIIKYKNTQHKVTKDDTILMEKMDLQVGDTFLFDDVLLVGTDSYTSLGRPTVKTCKVLATVESHSLTEKVIIFKKKRRKGYQRNKGHRQDVTTIKILKILHTPTEEIMNNYVKLI
jgi:large subunit ribosomal protein L21